SKPFLLRNSANLIRYNSCDRGVRHACDKDGGDRSSPFVMNLLGKWSDSSEDAVNIAWIRMLFHTLRPAMTMGRTSISLAAPRKIVCARRTSKRASGRSLDNQSP